MIVEAHYSAVDNVDGDREDFENEIDPLTMRLVKSGLRKHGLGED